MARSELKFVGHSVPRVDGVDKVTGKTKFTGGLVIPGMLYGRNSPEPLSPCSDRRHRHLASPGMVAILTAADVSDLDPYYSGRPIIALDRVRYVCEPVAAVAAEDEDTAEETLSLIRVDDEQLSTAVGLETDLRWKSYGVESCHLLRVRL